MSKKTQMIALKDLQVNLFVRKALDPNRVKYFAERIQNRIPLPPIEAAWLNGKLEIVDGRHRKEGYEIDGWSEIEVVIVEVADETELIARAYKANAGGALPPNEEDTEHTVMLLLERIKAKRRQHLAVAELLGLPTNIARRYVDEVQSKMSRSRLQRAALAVTDGGLTSRQAAEQYGCDFEKLKEKLSGGPIRKHKQGVAEVQRELTKRYRSAGQKNAAAIRRTLEKFEDGDVTDKQVSGIFEHIEKLQKLAAKAITDWRKRFDLMRREIKAATKSEQAA